MKTTHGGPLRRTVVEVAPRPAAGPAGTSTPGLAVAETELPPDSAFSPGTRLPEQTGAASAGLKHLVRHRAEANAGQGVKAAVLQALLPTRRASHRLSTAITALAARDPEQLPDTALRVRTAIVEGALDIPTVDREVLQPLLRYVDRQLHDDGLRGTPEGEARRRQGATGIFLLVGVIDAMTERGATHAQLATSVERCETLFNRAPVGDDEHESLVRSARTALHHAKVRLYQPVAEALAADLASASDRRSIRSLDDVIWPVAEFHRVTVENGHPAATFDDDTVREQLRSTTMRAAVKLAMSDFVDDATDEDLIALFRYLPPDHEAAIERIKAQLVERSNDVT